MARISNNKHFFYGNNLMIRQSQKKPPGNCGCLPPPFPTFEILCPVARNVRYIFVNKQIILSPCCQWSSFFLFLFTFVVVNFHYVRSTNNAIRVLKGFLLQEQQILNVSFLHVQSSFTFEAQCHLLHKDWRNEHKICSVGYLSWT